MVQKKVVRDTSIDIARGIGIILMVLGHAAMPHNSVIFRFHMALFFIISGWCFSDKNIADAKSVVGFTVRKIKTLYLPYVLFNIVGCLLHNFFIRINIYTDNVLFLDASSIGGGNAYGLTTMLSSAEIKQNIVNILKFEGNIQLAGAAWFLKVMFGVSILWCLINWLLKTVVHFEEKERLFINAVISVFLMLVSWKWMKSDTHFKMQFETVASSYIMFATGYYWKKHVKKCNISQSIILAALSFSILYYCDYICLQNGWNSNVNIFDNPVMYIVSSYAGTILVMSVSWILNNFNVMQVFAVIGKHTLSILLFHFLSFKLVNLMQCYVYDLPLYRVASFPTLYTEKGWWVLYTVVGVFIPLMIAIIREKIKPIEDAKCVSLKNLLKRE